MNNEALKKYKIAGGAKTYLGEKEQEVDYLKPQGSALRILIRLKKGKHYFPLFPAANLAIALANAALDCTYSV